MWCSCSNKYVLCLKWWVSVASSYVIYWRKWLCLYIEHDIVLIYCAVSGITLGIKNVYVPYCTYFIGVPWPGSPLSTAVPLCLADVKDTNAQSSQKERNLILHCWFICSGPLRESWGLKVLKQLAPFASFSKCLRFEAFPQKIELNIINWDSDISYEAIF